MNNTVFLPREITTKIEKYLMRPEILAIKGPRQAGKTTLLKYLVAKLKTKISEDHLIYLTFEDKEILEKFTIDSKNFIKNFLAVGKNRYYFFLDEYQYVTDGGQKLKLLYDLFPQAKFIISGSSSLELASQTSRHLVGRMFSFNLYPFSFYEYINAKDKKLGALLWQTRQKIREFLFNGKSFDARPVAIYLKDLQRLFNKYVVFGGYPEVIKTSDPEVKLEILKNVINTYLEKDIIGLLQIGDFLKFKSLATILAAQTGNLLNYQQITNDTGIIFERLKKYLSILEETYVIKLLHPYYRNLTTELKKNPKNYFLDPGLRNYLVGNFSSPEARSDTGHLIEMTVLSNSIYALTDEVQYRYWRTTGGAEVDLILKKGELPLPIEVKYSSFKKPTISRSFHSFLNTYKPKTGVVLTKDFFGKLAIDNSKILFVPALLF